MLCCEQKMGRKEMKIIRQQNRFKTLIPHQICPCCGETRKLQIIRDGLTGRNKFVGTDFIFTRTKRKGIIRTKLICTDVFMCHTCGAEWEGDPYEK